MDDTQRIKTIENDVQTLKQTVAVLDERQARMHEDLGGLTKALENNTNELSQVNDFIANKKGFFAGVVTSLSIASGVFGAAAALVWQRMTT